MVSQFYHERYVVSSSEQILYGDKGSDYLLNNWEEIYSMTNLGPSPVQLRFGNSQRDWRDFKPGEELIFDRDVLDIKKTSTSVNMICVRKHNNEVPSTLLIKGDGPVYGI